MFASVNWVNIVPGDGMSPVRIITRIHVDSSVINIWTHYTITTPRYLTALGISVSVELLLNGLNKLFCYISIIWLEIKQTVFDKSPAYLCK